MVIVLFHSKEIFHRPQINSIEKKNHVSLHSTLLRTRHIHNHLFSNSLHRFSRLLWEKVCVCVYIVWTFSPDCLSQVLEWLLHWHAWHPALLKLKKPGWQTSHLSPYTPTLHSHTPELRNTTRKDGESGWNTKHSTLYTIWCETNSKKKKKGNIWPEFTDFISRTLLTSVTEVQHMHQTENGPLHQFSWRKIGQIMRLWTCI